ncbi:MAG: PqqD family protein [Planctomycetota bacterium]|nr:MAG: PqqD family protein [Planctomycetota bacterium]
MTKRYKQNPDVAWRTLEGKSVLVNLENQTTLMLNEVGSRVWEMFENAHTIEEVTGQIVADFDAPEYDVKKDVEEFTAELLEKRLLLEVADGG